MPKKKREEKTKNIFRIESKQNFFITYVIGVLLLSIGNSVFLNPQILSISFKKESLSMFPIFGALFSFFGILLLVYLFYRFYQRVPLKQKIKKGTIIYIVMILFTGLLVGLLGKVLYHITDWQYETIKKILWGVSSYVQGTLRFIFIYYCLNVYRSKAFDWKKKEFKLLLIGVLLMISLSLAISLFSSVIGRSALFISDVLITVGVVYFKLFVEKYVNEGVSNEKNNK